MIPGIKISMGGHDYEVPPLTIGQIRRLAQERQDLVSGDEEAKFTAICKLVHAALGRNYPETKLEHVEDLIDLGNMASIIAAIMSNSGLELGEATAVAKPNGAISTGSSPPPADTAIQ